MSLQVSGKSREGAREAHPPPPSLLDQSVARRAEKKFLLDRPIPLISGSGWPGPPSPPPPPLSEDLDPPMQVHYNDQVTFLVVSRQLMALYSGYQYSEYNTINWRDTTHFDSEDDYRTGLRYLFRTTFIRTIKLNLLLKWLLGSNLSQSNTLPYAHFSSYHPQG